MNTTAPISRSEFERLAAQLGIRHPFKDARCVGEYRLHKDEPASSDAYTALMVARGAALDAEGATLPAKSTTAGSSSIVNREMAAFTGVPSSAPAGECHFCGLDERTCDCR